MKAKRFKGQNMVEFAIILGLVVVCGIATWTLLGDNIVGLFTSSNNQVAGYDPFNVKVTGGNTDKTPTGEETTNTDEPEDTTPTITQTKTIGGQSVNFMSDGSATISFDSRDVTLSAGILDNLDEVFQTAGAEGLNDIFVNALESMIDELPDNEEAIEIGFGAGLREENDCFVELFGTCIGGDSGGDCNFDMWILGCWGNDIATTEGQVQTLETVNSIVLKVGDHLMMIQNDHSSTNGGKLGTFVIDGNVAGNEFIGSIDKKGGSNDYVDESWDFVSNYSDTDGISLDGDMIEDYGEEKCVWFVCWDIEEEKGSWDIDFDEDDFYQI